MQISPHHMHKQTLITRLIYPRFESTVEILEEAAIESFRSRTDLTNKKTQRQREKGACGGVMASKLD